MSTKSNTGSSIYQIHALNFSTTQEILGPDMVGAQIALRDRMRPLLAVFILLVEILTLASLIGVEIEQGTARALLVIPMRVSDLFMAKGVMGIVLPVDFNNTVVFGSIKLKAYIWGESLAKNRTIIPVVLAEMPYVR